MERLTINSQNNGFELNGKPFFYLADTAWSVFTNATLDEWEYYLKFRKQQGYNTIQINTLPQWDRSLNKVEEYPFALKLDKTFDFAQWNQSYYNRARKMCAIAKEYGFQLALVVLWTNYVPGTWGSEMCPDNILPYELIPEYVSYMVEQFEEFSPVYIVSGDTGFDTAESIDHYREVLKCLNELSKDSLKAFHIKRGYSYIPEEFLDGIDFYMYQSGHNRDEQRKAYELAEVFLTQYPKKPVVNAEPCYEQMGYSRQLYGRFNQEDIRKAAWTSILAGASAGITYGAHGIWNWKKESEIPNPILGEGFDGSDSWYRAVHYPGAWDYGWLKHFVVSHRISTVKERQEWLLNNTDEIRIGETEESILIYLPHATKIKLAVEVPADMAFVTNLSNGRIGYVDLVQEQGVTCISKHMFESDALIEIKKQK